MRSNFIAGREFELPEIKLFIDVVASSQLISKSKYEWLIWNLSHLTSKYEIEKLARHLYTVGRLDPEAFGTEKWRWFMAGKKDFDSIMREITGGLSGDSKADIAYLKDQMEKYKDHEMRTEILRACGRLMYKLIPDDEKEEFEKLIDNESAGMDAALDEARFDIYKKDFDKALRIMEALVSKVEDMNAFEMHEKLSERDFAGILSVSESPPNISRHIR